jgi:ornithine decarboxylase
VDTERRTPELVMDLDVVEDAYRRIVAALPMVTVHYATKCNPHPAVLTRLRAIGSSFEIASAVELDTLCRIGVEPAELIYSNPVKPIAHIARAYAAGVRRFAFDSLDELAKLAAVAPGASVFVRLAAHQTMSDVPSEGKFGVDPEAAVGLLLAARERGLDPYGIAFHVGSQMLSPLAWRRPLQTVGQVLEKLRPSGIRLRMVDLGGGFPARYGAEPLPLSEYADVIVAGLAELPYEVDALIEPGRAVVAEAGTLTTTVIGTALRHGDRWAHLDVGAFNGLMESLETGNRLRFPVSDSRSSALRDRFHLTGPTCDSQDTILYGVELSADLATGDRVYIGSTGSYTTVYASHFNGFDPPTVRHVAKRHPPNGSVAAAVGATPIAEWSRSIETGDDVGYARRDGGS